MLRDLRRRWRYRQILTYLAHGAGLHPLHHLLVGVRGLLLQLLVLFLCLLEQFLLLLDLLLGLRHLDRLLLELLLVFLEALVLFLLLLKRVLRRFSLSLVLFELLLDLDEVRLLAGHLFLDPLLVLAFFACEGGLAERVVQTFIFITQLLVELRDLVLLLLLHVGQLDLERLVCLIEALVDDHELLDLVLVVARLVTCAFDQVLVELFAKFLVFLRQRHFLLNQKLDVILEALRLAQLLQKLGDLLLLQLDRLVAGVHLDLDLLDLGQQLDELFVLGLYLAVELDDLVLEALNFVSGGCRQVIGHLSVTMFEQGGLDLALVRVDRLLQLHADTDVVAFKSLLLNASGVTGHLLIDFVELTDDLQTDVFVLFYFNFELLAGKHSDHGGSRLQFLGDRHVLRVLVNSIVLQQDT